MNELQVQAYGQMAQAIAQHVFEKAKLDDAEAREGRQDIAWPIYYHDYMSTFENAADCLRQLHVLRGVGDEDERAACLFVFSCEVSNVSAVAEQHWKEGPSFDELLAAFLDLFGAFGGAHWGFSALPNVAFGHDSRIRPALEVLASLGYLSSSEAGYVWTDRIARTMEQCGLWENGQPASWCT